LDCLDGLTFSILLWVALREQMQSPRVESVTPFVRPEVKIDYPATKRHSAPRSVELICDFSGTIKDAASGHRSLTPCFENVSLDAKMSSQQPASLGNGVDVIQS
jgi:hypothetical protein